MENLTAGVIHTCSSAISFRFFYNQIMINNFISFIKGNIFKIILCVWIILSVVYIGYDLWSDFRTKAINQAYLAGKNDTISQLFKEAERPECQPISVYNNEKQIQLINVTCLKQANANQ